VAGRADGAEDYIQRCYAETRAFVRAQPVPAGRVDARREDDGAWSRTERPVTAADGGQRSERHQPDLTDRRRPPRLVAAVLGQVDVVDPDAVDRPRRTLPSTSTGALSRLRASPRSAQRTSRRLPTADSSGARPPPDAVIRAPPAAAPAPARARLLEQQPVDPLSTSRPCSRPAPARGR
jgi:hypothetical protein